MAQNGSCSLLKIICFGPKMKQQNNLGSLWAHWNLTKFGLKRITKNRTQECPDILNALMASESPIINSQFSTAENDRSSWYVQLI